MACTSFLENFEVSRVFLLRQSQGPTTRRCSPDEARSPRGDFQRFCTPPGVPPGRPQLPAVNVIVTSVKATTTTLFCRVFPTRHFCFWCHGGHFCYLVSINTRLVTLRSALSQVESCETLHSRRCIVLPFDARSKWSRCGSIHRTLACCPFENPT